MGPASFEIFEPAEKKFRLTPNWIVLITWSVTIFFFWVFDTAFPPHSDFRSIWLICVVLITLCYLVASFFTYKPLNGTIAGKIIFEIDSVVVNNKVFELRDINNLDFYFGDYYGKSASSGRDANAKLYQGVNNYVTFSEKNNDSYLIYFKCRPSIAIYR